MRPAVFFVAFLSLAFLFPAGLSLAQEGTQVPPEDNQVGVNALILIGEPAGPPLSGEALDVFTEEVASAIRCPQCQGLSIADSSAKTAVAMKAELKELLAAGYDREQAFTYFEKSYGEFIRLAPKAEGFNLMVWIAPILGLLLGVGVIAMRLSRSAPANDVPARDVRRPAADAPAAAPDEGDAGDANDDDDGGDEAVDNGVVDELAAYRDRVRREVSS